MLMTTDYPITDDRRPPDDLFVSPGASDTALWFQPPAPRSPDSTLKLFERRSACLFVNQRTAHRDACVSSARVNEFLDSVQVEPCAWQRFVRSCLTSSKTIQLYWRDLSEGALCAGLSNRALVVIYTRSRRDCPGGGWYGFGDDWRVVRNVSVWHSSCGNAALRSEGKRCVPLFQSLVRQSPAAHRLGVPNSVM
jgi:hypothetical protein